MDEQEFYTTRKGVKVKVQSFPHLLPSKVQVAAEKKAKELFPATIPTYDEQLMGGGVQTFEHDAKSVIGNPEAERLFNEYQENTRKQTAYTNEKMMQFYILSGTDISLPTDGKWLARQKFFGLEVPEDENGLLYHYVTTELITDARELMALVEKIMQASGIDTDTLSAARLSFRHILGEEENTTERPDGTDSGSGEADPVVHVTEVSAISSNGTMEDFALAMGL